MKKSFLFTTALAAAIMANNASAAYQENPIKLGRDVILSNHQNENGNGGAIFNNNTSDYMSYTGTTFEGNSAQKGGAIYNQEANMELNGAQFSDNKATIEGGAISHNGSSAIRIYKDQTDASFNGNEAGIRGGAVSVNGSDYNSIYSGIFTGNRTTGTDGSDQTGGGAIYFGNGGSLYITQSGDNKIIFSRNEAADYGGAIATDRKNKYGSLSISGAEFNNNRAGKFGGALANNLIYTQIYGGSFSGNHAGQNGGAIWNGKQGEISFLQQKTTFKENYANGKRNDIHNEGAIFVGNGVSAAEIELDGGISGDGYVQIQEKSTLTSGQNTQIENEIRNKGTINVKGMLMTFKDILGKGLISIKENALLGVVDNVKVENIIDNSGMIGVLGNLTLNNDILGKGLVLVDEMSNLNLKENLKFENSIMNIGNISVHGNIDLKNNILGEGHLKINSGAKLNTYGNTQIDNTIANSGTISVNGNMCLNGNITGNGTNGTIIFTNGSSLTVNADKKTNISYNDIQNQGADLHIVFENGYNGEYVLVGEGASLDNEFDIIQDNNLYNIEKTDEKGKYNITKKEKDKISNNIGANSNQSNVIDAVISGGNSNNVVFDSVSSQIGSKLQSTDSREVKQAVEAATTLAPEAAPLVRSTQTDISNQIYNVVGTRLTGGAMSAGVASGDNPDRGNMWAQTLVNRSELDDTQEAKGYEADSEGVAFGFEKNVTDSTKVGFGYAYTTTDVDGFMRDKDIKTHTAIVYGEYKPNNWYANAIATYGWSDYKENKYVLGHNVNADYDVENIGVQVMTGYDVHVEDFNITPEIGMRYAHIKQETYTDSADQRVSSNDSDILTGVIGVKASKSWQLSEDVRIEPEVKAALTYDMMNDNSNSVVTLSNGSSYWVKGEELDRTGVEIGVGLTAEVNDKVEVSVSYEGKFRENYKDNTGLFNFKYKF